MDSAEWTQPCQRCGGEGIDRPGGCICPLFTDTGGFRIADLACSVHGVGGYVAQPDNDWEPCPTCLGRGWKWKPDTIETAVKAGRRAYNDAPVPIRQEDFVRRIVVAVLDTLGDTE